MKQGAASHSGVASTKVEPKPQAVNPGAVARIGIQQITYKKIPLYAGRGLKAPMTSTETHHCGSQGKH